MIDLEESVFVSQIRANTGVWLSFGPSESDIATTLNGSGSDEPMPKACRKWPSRYFLAACGASLVVTRAGKDPVGGTLSKLLSHFPASHYAPHRPLCGERVDFG